MKGIKSLFCSASLLASGFSAFAVLDIEKIFKPDGVVAKLRERGYQVDPQ